MNTIIEKSRANNQLRNVNATLRKAIEHKDKNQILYAYDLAEVINFDLVDKKAADEYDQLVEKANDVFYA